MATKKRKRFNEGGFTEAQDKAAGLEASKDEKVGFFERLRMGNIDQEGSEAYNRFGAGRAKADRARAESKPSTDVYRVDSGPGSLGMSDEDKPSTNVYRVDSGPGKLSTGATKVTPAKRPIAPASTRPSSSGAYRVDSGPGKLGLADDRRSATRLRDSQMGGSDIPAKAPLGNYSNEGRGRAGSKASVEQIPTDRFKPVSGERVTGSEFSRNAANTLAAMGPGKLTGVGAIGMEMRAARGAGDAAKKASDSVSRGSAAAQRRAELKKQAEAGIERNLKSEFQDLAASAAKSEREKVTNPLAWMSGPKGMADDFKRGGKVKAKVKKMASGGSTSGASKRADGIAQRGKTRGRIY